jgi:hypothetical protein
MVKRGQVYFQYPLLIECDRPRKMESAYYCNSHASDGVTNALVRMTKHLKCSWSSESLRSNCRTDHRGLPKVAPCPFDVIVSGGSDQLSKLLFAVEFVHHPEGFTNRGTYEERESCCRRQAWDT